MNFISHSEAETERLGAAVGRVLVAGDIVALEGPLGAGKTCLVRGIATGLGLDPGTVSSPTFVISQEYSDADFTRLIHLDAYRLTGPEDLESVGWDEMVEAADSVIAVEWPSRIAAALPGRLVRIDLVQLGEHDRLIRLSSPRSIAERLRAIDAPAGMVITDKTCRICGMEVRPEEPTFPFCSDRCRLADLNAWFDERYRSSRPIQADEELSD